MKKNIKYFYNISSEYEGEYGFDFNEINSFILKILDNLIKIDEISSCACFAKLDFKSLSFDVLFTGDEKIQEINRDYRNKDMPTDVITFALFADDDFKMVTDGDIYLGEILISVDTAKTQAKEGIKKEILTLICHGILHLFGFDHQTDEDYNFIVNIQDRVINSL